MGGYERTTRKPPEKVEPGRSEPVPVLTVVCHPDLERVGERALLPALARGRAVELSRSAPEFAQPGRAIGLPLETAFVSRSPVVLRPGSGGNLLVEPSKGGMRLRVCGKLLEAPLELTPDTLARGVDLELGGAVVLLLHLADASTGRSSPAYGLVGDSDAIWAARQAVTRVADLEVPILLRGESGTGKELVARAIHESGPRRNRPFVGVNLSAVTPTLAAAELFGTVKGAYTGAVSSQRGFFQAAHGGSLFLDEVGECPVDVQTMLLRAIENGEYFAVGSRALQRADVRLVAATDSDLEARARRGDFKEPLLHRLSAYEIWLAPLRERRDDIGRLVVHFAAQALAEIGERLPEHDGSAPPWIAANLVARLCRYHWPGNVRQLRNLIWQLVIDNRGGARIEDSPRLDRLLAEAEPDDDEHEPGDSREKAEPRASARRPADITEPEMLAAMEACRWDVAAAARRLGISRPSLYALIRKSSQVRTAEDLEVNDITRAIGEAGGDVDRAAVALRVSVRGLRRRLSRLEGD